jgi:hypothetical protein
MPDALADLKFAHQNVGLVLDGRETATVRYDLDVDVHDGDVLRFKTPGGTTFAYASVTRTADIPVQEAYWWLQEKGERHPSESATNLADRLSDHYGRDIRKTTPVTVIHFDLLTNLSVVMPDA